MLRIATTLVALTTAGASAWAQGESCPAPIRPGEYTVAPTDAMAVGDLIGGGYGMRLVAPADARKDRATVSVEACASGFIISAMSQDGIPFEWKMRLQDWRAENGQTYTGSWKNKFMTIKMDVVLTDPRTMAMQSHLSATAGGGSVRAQPVAVGQHVDQGPVEPYECRCRSELQKWIDGRIENARTLRDLFGNMAYRQRPDIFPPDNKAKYDRKWKPSVYKQVIYTMAGLEVSFDEAAELVARERWPEQMPDSQKSAAETGSVSDYYVPEDGEDDGTGTATVAYTNLANCEVTYGAAYRDECFPRIERHSTEVHEGVHVATCLDWRKRISEHPDLHEQADDEVKAYGAEIDFLESWIGDNCQ